MTKSFLLKWDPAAGQGLEVDEQEQRDKQGARDTESPPTCSISNNYDEKLLFSE
jgi:hypothetical protein